ncbi:DnaA N-terminal domain-containing protein [Neptunicoccus sediminis]|uniref:DnaA N-terminal domain-containing protein n=1 Tax=Neptunicoccus sediminis TaxID=1892596 RepID=UPI00084621E6|nr:DnaA N-terminal domain-containing protein [Neptunicoccus sediminis]
MEPKRLTGPEAGALKYDILTALTLIGLNGTATQQMTVLRLTALVTARYNWRANELSVGQRDMARMWAVNERTVKREIKRLLDSKILTCKRQGVRGRVGAYVLNLSAIAKLSAEQWETVGPDFAERMAGYFPHRAENVVKVDFSAANVTAIAQEPKDAPSGTWRAVQHALRDKDEAIFKNWYSRLSLKACKDRKAEILAPSRFVANYIQTHLFDELHHALEQEYGVLDEILISV